MPRNLLVETGFPFLANDSFGYELPDFREVFSKILRQEKIEFSRVRCWISQFRVAIMVEGLSDSANAVVKEIRGPKASAAFDYNNQALPAAKGFAAAQGLELKDLSIREIDGEKYLFATRTVASQPLEASLSRIQKALLVSIPFYTQPWRSRSVFPQPPLYFTAWLDDQHLPLEFEGVKSIKATAGRQFSRLDFCELTGVDSFLQQMDKFGLMTEPAEQKKVLDARIRSILPEGYRLRADVQRLQRLCLFSESLHPMLVRFNSEFLELPESVISRYLTMNTDYLPCEDAHGKLVPAVIALSILEKNTGFEATSRAIALNEKFSSLLTVFQQDANSLSERLSRIAEKLQACKGMSPDATTAMARCAAWISPLLKLNRDSTQTMTLMTLLQEGESTEIAKNLPNTGFAMVLHCITSLESCKPFVPVLQEMCSYFAGRIPTPQIPLAQMISLSILMRAHARLAGRMVVSPRRIFTLLKTASIKVDIFKAFKEIFSDFELDRRSWFEQVAEEVLRENQLEIAGDSYYSASEFDPCSFYEAARAWKDPQSLDIEGFSALFSRIRSKVERVERSISEKPCCELESEIATRLDALETMQGIDYLAIYQFFKEEKVNIEACLLNLPAVLDESNPAIMPRLAILQRLFRQISRLPFIKKEKLKND